MTTGPIRPDKNLVAPMTTRLPEDPAAARLPDGDLRELATEFPASSLVWAALAEQALSDGDSVVAYAFARTGYHRGLDALRRAGWRGQGPIPAEHEPNRGFLRSLAALSHASAAIGDDDEAERCASFLVESGTSLDAVAALER